MFAYLHKYSIIAPLALSGIINACDVEIIPSKCCAHFSGAQRLSASMKQGYQWYKTYHMYIVHIINKLALL